MPVLAEPITAAGRAGLAALIAGPARALVAIDFDGTLSPIVERPEQARAAPGAVAALATLADRVGTCAVLTGRAADTVVELGGLSGVGSLVVLGHYGLQRWQDGRLDTPPPHPGVARLRERLPELLAGAADGVAVEDKEHSLVVHTRRTADPAGERDRLQRVLAPAAAAEGLEVVGGRYLWELRPPGIDKGSALHRLAAERGAGAVAFLGDDVGDLPAFAAVDALRADGVPGLKVCSVSAEETGLRAHADLLVDGPAGVVAFLAALAGAIGEGVR